MPTRRRPRAAVTLAPHIIVYVNEYARAHGGLTFSRAVEALIKEHAEAAAADKAADQTDEGGNRPDRRALRRWA